MSKAGQQKRAQVTLARLCAVGRNLVYVSTMPDDQELGVKFAAICQYADGAWSYETFPYAIERLALFKAPRSPHRILHLLSEDGIVVNFQSKAIETVLPRNAAIRKGHRLGLMSNIKQIGVRLYVVGDGGQNFRRADDGTWSPLDESLFDGPDDERNRLSEELGDIPSPTPADIERYIRLMKANESKTFLGFDGTSEASIYACTNESKIFWFDGQRFASIPADTDRALLAILAQSEETVWVCGRQGALLFGNHATGFRQVSGVEGAPYFSSMAWFDGKLYLGSYAQPRGLFVREGLTVRRVFCGLTPDIEDVNMIEAIDGVLWVMGSKDLLRFDGETWQRIAFPGNDPVR